jgi:hypothetical protein
MRSRLLLGGTGSQDRAAGLLGKASWELVKYEAAATLESICAGVTLWRKLRYTTF